MLIIFQHPPLSINQHFERLEMSIGLAALEKKVSLLFLGPGVFHLCKNNDEIRDYRQPIQKLLSQLPSYGIENIFVDQNYIKKNNILDQIISSSIYKMLNPYQINQQLATHKIII